MLPSRDGSVRKVKISLPRFNDEEKAMSPSILERSVCQLCPLELVGDEESETRMKNSLEFGPRNDEEIE